MSFHTATSRRGSAHATSEQGLRPSSFYIHPQALCESAEVGSGSKIWPFAHVMSGARVGNDCNIGEHAFVESGAIIGNRVTIKNGAMIWRGVTIDDDAFIGPGVLFTNDSHPRSPRSEAAERYKNEADWLVKTHVARGATVGAGAVVVCGVQVGPNAMIGAGAVVTHDVPAHRLVIGNPARPAGWVCRCGAKLNSEMSCSQCHRTYRLAGDSLLPVE